MSEESGTILHSKKEAFLAAYVECGTVSHAARAAGICRDTHYEWLNCDEDYAVAFEKAKKDACECLEREARRRAIEGVDEPVYQNGQLVGYKRRYSDTLLIFMLKGEAPDKYKDRIDQQLTANLNAANMQINVVMDKNWYANENRLDSILPAASGEGASLPCPSQGCVVREAVGKNGNGSNGNGHRPRPE